MTNLAVRKDNKMQVSIEEIESMAKRRAEINSDRLRGMVFTKAGKVLHIPIERIKEFEFTGLNNIDFITSGFYETGWLEPK
jgi:hypothetical protein